MSKSKEMFSRKATIGRRILTYIQLLLLLLKWFGVIAWPYWIILLPLWGTVVFAFVLFPFYKLVLLACVKRWKARRT